MCLYCQNNNNKSTIQGVIMYQTSPYEKSQSIKRDIMTALDVIDKKPDDAKVIIGSAMITAFDLVEQLDADQMKRQPEFVADLFDDAGNKSIHTTHKDTVDSVRGSIRIVNGKAEGVEVRMYLCDHCTGYFYTGTRTIDPFTSVTCPYCGTIHKGTEDELDWIVDMPSTSKVELYNRINKNISSMIFEMLKSDDNAHHGMIYRLSKEQAIELVESNTENKGFRPYGKFVICNRAPRGKDRHDLEYMPWSAIHNDW